MFSGTPHQNGWLDRPNPVLHFDDESDRRGSLMLILTRRVGEALMIGEEVTVTVMGVNGNQVRLGINAPKDVAVHREEIYDRIKQEKDDASR